MPRGTPQHRNGLPRESTACGGPSARAARGLDFRSEPPELGPSARATQKRTSERINGLKPGRLGEAPQRVASQMRPPRIFALSLQNRHLRQDARRRNAGAARAPCGCLRRCPLTALKAEGWAPRWPRVRSRPHSTVCSSAQLPRPRASMGFLDFKSEKSERASLTPTPASADSDQHSSGSIVNAPSLEPVLDSGGLHDPIRGMPRLADVVHGDSLTARTDPDFMRSLTRSIELPAVLCQQLFDEPRVAVHAQPMGSVTLKRAEMGARTR